MWFTLLSVALLAGNVLSQGGFVRNPSAPLRPIAPYYGFHQRPIVQAPIRGSVIVPIADFGLSRPAHSGNPCSPSPCGPSTRCDVNNHGTALCRCIDDYVPDDNTIKGCKPQCIRDDECPEDYQCTRNKCARVCRAGKVCGLHARCIARNHRAECQCPSGYTGHADTRCTREVIEVRTPRPVIHINPCSPNPCGTSADCRESNERAVCSCPRGYEGNALQNCRKGECIEHRDCNNNRACQNLRCYDPCGSGVCGTNAECNVRNHQPICSCPKNYIGQPFTSCRRVTEYDICNPTPCGSSTNCRAKVESDGSMRAVCSCIDNYIGSPLTGCRPECTSDRDCNSNQQCQKNRCRNPCVDGCGEGAYCNVRNNRADCSCPEFFKGDPHSRCYPECTKHEDCRGFEACSRFSCVNPCDGSCGTGADCKVEDHTPICSCPRGFTGDPFQSCRAFTREDLCRNNPCGTDAECHPGTDKSGKDRPVCVCPTGYIGNPLSFCQRGECETHSTCRENQACYQYQCVDPCHTSVGSVCGEDANCSVKNHVPVCSCPRGYEGNSLERCVLGRNARVAGRTNKK